MIGCEHLKFQGTCEACKKRLAEHYRAKRPSEIGAGKAARSRLKFVSTEFRAGSSEGIEIVVKQVGLRRWSYRIRWNAGQTYEGLRSSSSDAMKEAKKVFRQLFTAK